MIEFILNHPKELTNSCGIFFDIIGAWLVAWEVVREYKGKRYSISPGVSMGPHVLGQNIIDTDAFKKWESSKYNKMKYGLAFLTFGFILQIISNWLPSHL